ERGTRPSLAKAKDPAGSHAPFAIEVGSAQFSSNRNTHMSQMALNREKAFD
ncbi:uncharacterized protein METZ01_LOCUS411768, partial [marine metagenome]